jgi:hypothetical protein
MARNILNDTQNSGKRSIREIQMDSDRRRRDFEESAGINPHSTPHSSSQAKQNEESGHIEKNIKTMQKKETRIYDREEIDIKGHLSRNGSKIALWVTAVVCLLIVFYVFSIVFAGATLTVTPKEVNLSINSTLTANKSAGTVSALTFQLITLSEQESKNVPASGQKNVSSKASGKIIIYNNSSTASQTLIKNTRFQSPEGLIYRIPSSISVPGKKGGVPGSLGVTVYADQVGSNYNIGLSDFVLPGFKDNPVKYKNIYARSATPMTGGSSGVVSVVSDSDLQNAQKIIQSDLQTLLLKEAKAQTPEHFVLYSNAAFYTFEALPVSNQGTQTAVIAEKGTLHAIIFDKANLAQAIAKNSLSNYDGKDVYLAHIDQLNFSLQGNDLNAWQNDTISFTIQGQDTLIWNYSVDSLKQALVGKNAKDVPAILNNYPEISKTELVLRPFWKNSFPDDIKKIVIINKQN